MAVYNDPHQLNQMATIGLTFSEALLPSTPESTCTIVGPAD